MVKFHKNIIKILVIGGVEIIVPIIPSNNLIIQVKYYINQLNWYDFQLL